MKKIIPVLILTHLLCILLGFCLGTNLVAQKTIPEATITTETEIPETEEYTFLIETTEQTIPTEETIAATEAPEEATEAAKAQYVPVYTPVATTPPATQPPATEPPSTHPPATQPPAQGGNQNISGETPED